MNPETPETDKQTDRQTGKNSLRGSPLSAVSFLLIKSRSPWYYYGDDCIHTKEHYVWGMKMTVPDSFKFIIFGGWFTGAKNLFTHLIPGNRYCCRERSPQWVLQPPRRDPKNRYTYAYWLGVRIWRPCFLPAALPCGLYAAQAIRATCGTHKEDTNNRENIRLLQHSASFQIYAFVQVLSHS